VKDKKDKSVIESRRRVNRAQKAWKFILDVNSITLENLNDIAVYDGENEYTYGQMFKEWQRYGAVFSALGMTSLNKSKVGILGSTSAEVLFSVYGLNMTGAAVSIVPSYSAFFPHKIMETIRHEGLTDFIITDDFAQVNLINELLLHRMALGLNNIIILHVSVGGATVENVLTAAQEMKYMQVKSSCWPICMDELLTAYGNGPVTYAVESNDESAFVLHTSGTTSGAGKPIVLSDGAFNNAVASFYEMEDLDLPYDNLVSAVIVDLSNAYGLVDQVHLPFAMGASVVMVPAGVLNPWFYKAIPKYKISFLFTISAMFERWMKMKDNKALDFSSLKFVAIGGSSVSSADKKRFCKFMQDHGAGDITLLNGYGISELCGACCLSSPDLEDESIGYPLPGVEIRLYDEESGSFLPAGKRPAEGVMYLTAPFTATTRIDGKEILKAEYIDDKPYICTNDLVKIEKDGKVHFLGRANRYFINDEGRKYESGRVETEIARQEGIGDCCVVPIYVKTAHDNMPMLCVQPVKGKEKPREVVIDALKQVFITEKTLPVDYIPFRVMISESLPRNGNGKIDLYRIGRGEVEGDVFTVETVKILKHVTDIKLKPYKECKSDMIKEVFDGISKEIKSSLPFNCGNNSEERWENNNMNKAFESFNSMNRMGMQMMNNMMGKMSNMPGCQNMMPNFQNMMPGFQNMMPNFQNMMPNFQNMMNGFMGMMPGCQNPMMGFGNMMPGFDSMKQCVKDQVKCAGPKMQNQMEQMMEYMNQMNQISLEAMQKMYELNTKMMNQCFTSMQQMTADVVAGMTAGNAPEQAGQETEPEAESEPEPEADEQPAKEPEEDLKPVKKVPVKKAASKTPAKAAATKKPVKKPVKTPDATSAENTEK
jgi:acyl-coenzyme A synthetase/AMP-(fatty) acid ligase